MRMNNHVQIGIEDDGPFLLEFNQHLPPVSSLTTMMSTPSATSFFRVDASTS